MLALPTEAPLGEASLHSQLTLSQGVSALGVKVTGLVPEVV